MATTATAPKRRRGFRFGYRGGLAGYLFVAPSLLFLTVFVILPILAAFYYSLTDYDLMRAPRFAGSRRGTCQEAAERGEGIQGAATGRRSNNAREKSKQ